MPTHFGDFTIDESQRLLLRGNKPLHISPKAFQLLLFLISESPNPVSKHDLRERLWPDTIVNEGNLTNMVAELRAALGDNPRKPRFIRTLYGFGYAFVLPTDDRSPTRIAMWKRGAGLLTALAMTCVILVSVDTKTAPFHADEPPAIRSLAVLPFDTSATDPGSRHLGIALPDLLITRLSNVHSLIVRPTSAIRDFDRVSSLRAGRALKVDAVLEGSISTTPERVRVTVQLLDTHDQKAIWAGEFDHARTDVFAIEDGISEQVADALMVQLSPSERARLARRYTTNPEAFALYIEGRYRSDQELRAGHNEFTSAIAILREAVRKDPSYALAWASMAEMYAAAGGFNWLPPRAAFREAREAVDKALELDNELSEAHCASGVIKMYADRDYLGAEREFVRALELSPRNTLALMHYGRLIQCLGRFDEAIALRKREIEIDPLNPGVQSFLAAAYVTARKDDLGIQQCRLVLRMDPNFSLMHTFLARLYAVRGEYDRAIAEGRMAARTEKDGRQGLALLGYALGMSGRKEEASAILQQLERDKKTQPFDLAIVKLALGQKDDALNVLDKAVDDGTYFLRLKTEPIFLPLHSDPRFRLLLRRAGFEGPVVAALERPGPP